MGVRALVQVLDASLGVIDSFSYVWNLICRSHVLRKFRAKISFRRHFKEHILNFYMRCNIDM